MVIGRILFITLIFFQASHLMAQPLAGTLTVGGVSPDYQSLNDAVADLNVKGADPGGVTFSIREGDYAESLLITAKGSGSGKIRFVSEQSDADKVKISFAGASDVIRLRGATFIELEHLKISYTGTGSNSAIELSDNTDDLTVKNCIIEGAKVNSTAFAAAAIFADENLPENDCERISILENIIRFGSYGIALSMSAGKPAGLKISNNRIEDFYGSGIYLSSYGNLQITNNRVSTVQSGNSSCKGIQLDDCDGAHQLTGNYVLTRENGRLGYGLYFEGSSSVAGQEILVANNSVQVSNTSSISYGIYQSNNSNWYLYHSNTVYVSGGTSVSSNCYNTFNAADDTWLINNIFMNASTATGNSAGLVINIANQSGLAGAGNNCYFSSGAGTPFRARFGTTYNLFSEFTAASGEQNGLNIDPQMQFIDGVGWKASNPLLAGAGADTSLFLSDIEGNLRVRPTTIGAHEFQLITGHKQPAESSLQLFYAQQQLVLRSDIKVSFIMITDLSGRLIHKALIAAEGNELRIPFIPPAQGIYLVSVFFGNQSRSFKIPVVTPAN